MKRNKADNKINIILLFKVEEKLNFFMLCIII